MTDINTETLPTKKSADAARRDYIRIIADKIQSLIRDENFNPSDIMVLVQRRNPFASPLVNELKSRNIDVAGSDRIILPEFPAIRDLLNLVRFCLDNSDDYSLCCTLKSPIYSLKERDILNICTKRTDYNKSVDDDKNKVRVFDILQNTHPEIFNELNEIIEWSKTLAPYSFFTRVLNTNDHRRKMIAALGTQIIDPIEEFITICLSYERTQPGTLKHFIKWFITGGSEVKRDMDASSGVRVVTVHGSKGLESPVVFLIDTIRTPRDKPEKVLKLKSDKNEFTTWLWAPQKNASEQLLQASETAMYVKISEYYRLLYVAMTRARDRLYVYGFKTKNSKSDIAWHTQLMQILSESEISTKESDGTVIIDK